jgi:hypothetical protein
MDFVQGVPKAGMLINIFSDFLRPYVCSSYHLLRVFYSIVRLVGPYFSPLPRYEREATEVIGDLLRHRIAMFEKHGKGWEMKPVGSIL